MSIEEKYTKCRELLQYMTTQADEDTPSEYRSKHFRDAMEEAISFLEETKEDESCN